MRTFSDSGNKLLLAFGKRLDSLQASSRPTCSRWGRSILTFAFKAFIINLPGHYAGGRRKRVKEYKKSRRLRGL
jgi:hypothetical protein